MKTRSYSNAENSRFSTLARVDPAAIKWIKEHKDTRTIAGFLDKIINEHIRRYENQKTGDVPATAGAGGDQAHTAPH